MIEINSLADRQSMHTHHGDVQEQAITTAELYRKQRERGIGRQGRHNTLGHLAYLMQTTLDIEHEAGVVQESQTALGRVRDALRLTRRG